MRRCCRCAATFAQPCLVLLLKHAVLALAGCIVLASSTWPHVMCQRLPCRPPCLPCPPCSVQQQHVAHMHGTADVWAAAGPLVLRAVRPHGVRPRQGCTRWCQLAWQMFLCFGQLRGSQGRGRLASGLQHGSSSQCCDQPHRLRCPPLCPACSMPLFLYNFQSKQLHVIFKAASDGEHGPTGSTVGFNSPGGGRASPRSVASLLAGMQGCVPWPPWHGYMTSRLVCPAVVLFACFRTDPPCTAPASGGWEVHDSYCRHGFNSRSVIAQLRVIVVLQTMCVQGNGSWTPRAGQMAPSARPTPARWVRFICWPAAQVCAPGHHHRQLACRAFWLSADAATVCLCLCRGTRPHEAVPEVLTAAAMQWLPTSDLTSRMALYRMHATM